MAYRHFSFSQVICYKVYKGYTTTVSHIFVNLYSTTMLGTLFLHCIPCGCLKSQSITLKQPVKCEISISVEPFVHANVWIFSFFPLGLLLHSCRHYHLRVSISKLETQGNVTLERWRMHFRPHMLWCQRDNSWLWSWW